MPTLRELQHSFARAVTEGDELALGIRASMAGRLEIYANTRRATLAHALALSFPAVRALVGAAFFDALARQFAAATPPTSAYLNDYGGELPRFLRSYEPAAAVGYLADVAELEWAVSRAWHAADAARLDPRELAELAPEDLARLIFFPHPSVAALRLAYPADRIWQAVLEQDEAAMRAVDLGAGPVHLLVERDLDGQVQIERLAPEAWHLTRGLLAGEALFQALASAPTPTAAQATLAEHLAAGRFIGYRLDSTQGDPRV